MDDEIFVGVGQNLRGAKSVPIHDRKIIPMCNVLRWGKGREYGDRAGWLVAELNDGSKLWGRVSWQRVMNNTLKKVSNIQTPDSPGIYWLKD